MGFYESTASVADGPEAMLSFKGSLHARGGWTIRKTSDTVTYSDAGDILTTAVQLATPLSFFVAVAPSGQEFLFQNGGGFFNEVWSTLYSVVGFTGGTASARPTAADEFDPFAGASQFFPDSPFTLELGVEDVSPCRWYVRGTTMSQDIAIFSIGAATHPLVVVGQTFGLAVIYKTDNVAMFAAERAMLLAVSAGGGGSGDTTPPVIDNFDPTDTSTIARADSLSVDVTDDSGDPGTVTIWVMLDGTAALLAYDGTDFLGSFEAGSSKSTITDGFTFELAYDAPGWPATTLNLLVRAIDAAGNRTDALASFTVSDPPAAADATAPSVTLVSPAEDSEITRTTPLVVDVTDASAFAALFVWVTYATGRDPDLVHDGDTFMPAFAGSSKRVSLSGGYRYTLRRTGGWPASPTVRFRPVDSAGNTP